MQLPAKVDLGNLLDVPLILGQMVFLGVGPFLLWVGFRAWVGKVV